MARLRDVHVRARLPGPRRRGASTRGSSACCARCSTTTSSTRAAARRCDGAGRERRARDRLPRRHDRPLLHPRVRGAAPCRGSFALMARYTRRLEGARPRRGRHGRARLGAHASCAGRARTATTGLCPFHEERTRPSASTRSRSSTTASAARWGATCSRFVQETEGLDFAGAIELLAERYGVELELEHEDPQAAERRERRDRLLELLDRTAAFYARYLWESAEAGRRASYLRRARPGRGDAARLPRRLRARARGTQVLLAALQAGFSERGAARRRPGPARPTAARPLRPLPGRGSCSRWRPARARAGLRRARDARGPAARSTSTRAEGELFHKGRQLFGVDLARAARRARPAGGRGRGLHRRARPAPGRDRERGRA